MGRIGRVISFSKRTRKGARLRETTVRVDGGNNVVCEHMACAGDDSYPCDEDYTLNISNTGSGREVIAGYLDPKNLHKASKGEKRIYARSSDGVQVCEFWLKNDGSFRAENSQGYIELFAGGDCEINGAKITKDGDVITSNGISLKKHPHSQGNDSDGNSQVATNAPTPTEE